jgi:Protein of unknown function (DUF2283)
VLNELKEVKSTDDVLYLYFSNLPISRTQSLANGEINVDLDHYGHVVGIEVLSLGPEQMQALSGIVAEHKLSLSNLAKAFAHTL